MHIKKPNKRDASQAGVSRESKATINRRRRRRVVRMVAGAVVGGLIAGPLGVVAGGIAGASRKRGPQARQSAGRPKRASQTATTSKSANARAAKRRAISKPKKTTVNIYPPIP